MDNEYLKKTAEELDKQELEYMREHYPTSQVYKGLGLTRDALRYYEELGLLEPRKNEENSYREYSIYDIHSILAIDFYKKRGVTPKELKAARESADPRYYKELLAKKKSRIEKEIADKKRMLNKLEETLDFCDNLEREVNVFQVKDFPLYAMGEEFSSVINFKEYGEKILNQIDTSEEDLYSTMIRVLEVDDNGYTGSKGYFVKRAEQKAAGHSYLESGPALYMAIEDKEENSEGLMEKMFTACTWWAQDHGKVFKGVVYLQPRFIYFAGKDIGTCIECWVPLKN